MEAKMERKMENGKMGKLLWLLNAILCKQCTTPRKPIFMARQAAGGYLWGRG